MTKRLLLAAAAPVLAAALLGPPSSAAVTARFAGDDRFETAAEVSAVTFHDGADVVYVATGEAFADALAGGAAAAFEGAPVLLTLVDELPEATATELNRLTPTTVRVLGGERAVSTAVVAAIRDATGADDVMRIAGNNRYTTAVELSQQLFAPDVDNVVIVNGELFPDAVAGGAIAAARGGPVLLVQHDDIPDTVALELERLNPDAITVLGGSAAVADSVVAELDQYTIGDVVRLAGLDRFRTAAISSAATFETAENPAAVDIVYLASGRGFADALAATPAAGVNGAPVLLVQPGCIPGVVRDEIERLDPETVALIGGEGSLASGVEGGDVCEEDL